MDNYKVVLMKESLKTYRLNKISTPKGTVTFSYYTQSRYDVPSMKALRSVTVLEKNLPIYSYKFQYQYFFTSLLRDFNEFIPENQRFMTRLCLKSVRKVGSDSKEEHPYIFDYYTGDVTIGGFSSPANANYYDNGGGSGDIVPPMFSFLTDHWGYYNYNFHNRPNARYEGPPFFLISSFPGLPQEIESPNVNKKISLGLAKNGILKSVSYPMGGAISYEYEQNEVLHDGQNILSGGVRVNKTVLFDGIDHGKDISTEYKYVLDNGLSSGWGYEEPLYKQDRDMRVYRDFQGKRTSAFVKDFATSVVTDFVQRQFAFGEDGILLNFSASTAANIYRSVLLTVISLLFELFSSPPPDYIEHSGKEYFNVSLRFANPLPRLYSRVEVIKRDLNGDAHGKAIYKFTSKDDGGVVTVPELGPPYSNEIRFINESIGLPRAIFIVDNNGVPVSETTFDYEIQEIVNNTGTKSKSWRVKKYFFLPSNIGVASSILNGTDNIIETNYFIRSFSVRLKSKTERVYKNGESSESTTTYSYNGYNLMPSLAKTLDSKGDKIEVKSYYPQDYNGNIYPVLKAMVSENVIAVPVATETWKTRPGGTPELVGTAISEFSVAPDGEFRPQFIYSLVSESPVPEAAIGVFDPDHLIRNTNLIAKLTENVYDQFGNSVMAREIVGSRVNSVLYDFAKENPIAQITNAAEQEVAFTSFEEIDPAGLDCGGKWQARDRIILDTKGQCPTGVSSFSLRETDGVYCDMNFPKDYKLSFWSTTSNFRINGVITTAAISAPEINGWTYYEFNIPKDYQSQILITGDGLLDELRLYPANATMKTLTYIRGKGKRDECDINNRINYFEYDGLGRITLVKDEKRNVIKTYEYNYKTN